MRFVILGIFLGMCVEETVTVLAKDALNRSPQQQYDYFRERQQQLDIGHMRKQMDKQEFDRKYGRMPC